MIEKTTANLEHSNVKLKNTHRLGDCKGEFCTIHHRSDHSMRSFPQHWRWDRGIMERICPHGVGHVDPDEITEDRTHGCDGCCYDGTYQTDKFGSSADNMAKGAGIESLAIEKELVNLSIDKTINMLIDAGLEY